MQVPLSKGRLVKIRDDPAPAIRLTTLILAGVLAGVAVTIYVRADITALYPEWSEGSVRRCLDLNGFPRPCFRCFPHDLNIHDDIVSWLSVLSDSPVVDLESYSEKIFAGIPMLYVLVMALHAGAAPMASHLLNTAF
jgi:hypothetical protein